MKPVVQSGSILQVRKYRKDFRFHRLEVSCCCRQCFFVKVGQGETDTLDEKSAYASMSTQSPAWASLYAMYSPPEMMMVSPVT